MFQNYIKASIALLMLISPALGVMRDSVDFPNKYEGNVIPSSAGFIYSGATPASIYNTLDSNYLTIDTLTSSGYQASYWYQNPGHANVDVGYTVEIRLKVISSVNSGTNVNRGFWLSAKAGSSGVILSFLNDGVLHRGGGDSIIITGDNTDAFHTYRIVIRTGGTTFDVYRDGTAVIQNRAIGYAWEELGFGDPTSNTSAPDMNVIIDYLRWDTTGAYEPVRPVVCGEAGVVYYMADINKDCRVDFGDLYLFVSNWTGCSDAERIDCSGFRRASLNYEISSKTLTLNGKDVLRSHWSVLDGPKQDWSVSESGQNDHYTIYRMNSDNLRWESSIDRVNQSVWEFTHTIKNQSGSNLIINQLRFGFNPGTVVFDKVTKAYSAPFTSDIVTATTDIGSWLGYAILHDLDDKLEAHFYFPDWLDIMGNFSINRDGSIFSGKYYFDVYNDLANSSYRNSNNPYTASWSQINYSLAPGQIRTVRYRVGVFNETDRMLSSSETSLPVGAGYYYYRSDRSKMLDMGIPLSIEHNDYPGHIMIIDWSDLQDTTLLKWMADAGTGIVVLRSPDFRDISHGLSWNGDYNLVPPNLDNVLDQIHGLGMKAVWWFSIRGALYNDSARNNGSPDSLVVAHPEWFLPNALYWSNCYIYADMFAQGWKDWCIQKIQNDLSTVPKLDGFAFDEPYFYGNAVSHSPSMKTFARNGRDFLGQLMAAVKKIDSRKLVVANFWYPAADAYDYFDYTCQEGAGLQYLTSVTLGKSCGARGIGPLFEWGLTLSHFEYLYLQEPVGLAWVHPSWYQVCRPYSKDPNLMADVIKFLGHSKLLAGVIIGEGVSQLELIYKGERYLFIINGSDKDISVQLNLRKALPVGVTIGEVTIDTASQRITKTTPVPASMQFTADVVPAESIYRVRWK